jgi:DNA invertase Pin-like site-specific DNA recombinase
LRICHLFLANVIFLYYTGVYRHTIAREANMGKVAYGYLRVSGLGQVEGHGLGRQLEAIEAYAKRYGYKIVQVFKEEGISGTTDESNRPAFQTMMTEILRNGIKTVIIESLDRIAREYRVQESLLIYMAAKGVDLISARTEENVTQAIQADPMKRALIQIQGVFSELEKNLLVRKLRNGREKVRREKGKCEGAKAYGETEEERAIIRSIKLMRRRRRGGFRGMTLLEIANKLNEEGVPTKRGKTWTPTQVRRCLSF